MISALALLLAFSFTGRAQALCQASFTYSVSGSQVTLTNTSANTTTNTAYYWSWSGPGGWGQSSVASPTFNFTYNGTYYVYLMITDSLANCQSYVQDSIVITTGQACQVGFTYTIGTNGQVSFTNTSLGNVSYYWGFGDGGTSTQASPTYTYLYNGTYTVYLWADTTGGYCGGYYQTTITITNATPCNLTTGFTQSNNGNGIYIFTDTVTVNPSTTVHLWYVNGAYVGTGNPFTYPFNMNGAYTVCDVATDSAGTGCADSTCANVTVGGVLCTDSAFFFLYPDSSQTALWNAYLYTMNGNWPTSATWSWGDNTSSTGLFPSHTYAQSGWYTICLTATFACGNTSTYCSTDSIYKMSGAMVTVNVINGTNGVHTNTNSMTSLKAYPNPFNEDITLNFTSYENNSVTCILYDMMGNQVMSENVNVHKGDNEIKLNTNVIGKGVYFLSLDSDNGKKTSTIKVVK